MRPPRNRPIDRMCRLLLLASLAALAACTARQAYEGVRRHDGDAGLWLLLPPESQRPAGWSGG